MIYKTIVKRLTLLFTKCYTFKKKGMHMTGYILIRRTFAMTLRFLILPSFLFTRNLGIDKNYMLSIFMLVVLYNSIPIFSLTRHAFIIKPCPFSFIYQTILMLIHFHMLSLYKSLIISKYAFSHATNHLTQIMRFKHILQKMYLVYKSHLHSSKFVISLCLYNSHS